MLRSLLLPVTLIAFSPLFGAGCGSSALPGDSDLTVAAADLSVLPDLIREPDLRVAKSGIGDPCMGNGSFGDPGDCKDPKNEMCIPDGQFGFTGGYCTQQCSGPADCPSDSRCVDIGQGNFMLCFLRCNSDANCRSPDYRCSPKSQTCVPINSGGNGGGVSVGTRDGGACVMPVIEPGQGLKGPFGPNTEISGKGGQQSETFFAVDSKNHSIVVGFNDNANMGPMGEVSSSDDGKNWTSELLLPMDQKVLMDPVQSDPVVAVDGLGDFWISWLGFTPGGGSGQEQDAHVWVLRSKDGGLSFPEVFQVSPMNEFPGMGGGLDKPWVAVNPVDNSIYVTWTRFTQQEESIRMAHSVDQGKSWVVSTVSDSGARPQAQRNLAQITVGADGRPAIVWAEIGQQQFGSTDNQVYFQRINADGTRLGGNVLVTAGSDSPAYDDPSIALAGKSVYVGFISGSPRGDWDVRVAASLDGGAHFSPSVKVNDDATCATHFHHQIAVDGKGAVHAIWFDNRFLEGNVFYAESGPADLMNPLKFGANVFVNDTPFEFTTRRDMSNLLGDYLGLAIGNQEIYAAWTDARITNNSHIFFAKAPLK